MLLAEMSDRATGHFLFVFLNASQTWSFSYKVNNSGNNVKKIITSQNVTLSVLAFSFPLKLKFGNKSNISKHRETVVISLKNRNCADRNQFSKNFLFADYLCRHFSNSSHVYFFLGKKMLVRVRNVVINTPAGSIPSPAWG